MDDIEKMIAELQQLTCALDQVVERQGAKIADLELQLNNLQVLIANASQPKIYTN